MGLEGKSGHRSIVTFEAGAPVDSYCCSCMAGIATHPFRLFECTAPSPLNRRGVRAKPLKPALLARYTCEARRRSTKKSIRKA